MTTFVTISKDNLQGNIGGGQFTTEENLSIGDVVTVAGEKYALMREGARDMKQLADETYIPARHYLAVRLNEQFIVNGNTIKRVE